MPTPVTTLADKLLEVHTWLREQLAEIRDEAAAHLDARAAHDGDDPQLPPPGLGFQIRRRCLAFCDALTFHHTGEDGAVFPGVERYHPELIPVLDRLRAEHREVARIKEELLALLADLATPEPDELLAHIDRLTKELTVHLDYEEEWLVPVLTDVPFPPPAQP
ncbi:hemerythrin domain-containing protein [Actinomycetota bacterium Odt1-20B]